MPAPQDQANSGPVADAMYFLGRFLRNPRRDVRDAAAFVAARGLPPVRIVLSGLPLLWMPDEQVESIFAGLRVFMHKDGVFRTFSYVHNYPTPGAIKLRARLYQAFGSYDLSRPVLRNVPPAFVLSCTTPASLDEN